MHLIQSIYDNKTSTISYLGNTRIKLSTVWPHIAETYEKLAKMATNSIAYTVENEEGGIEIMEEGFITSDNINKMKFTFSKPQDITESLHKNNSRSRDEVSATKKGRIGYSSLTCTYPNRKDTSSKIVLTDCTVQYREGIDREKSGYGRSYVAIGIPTIYISKISSDAKQNSSINVGVKENVKSQEGCFWLNCSLDNLPETNTWIIYRDENGDEVGGNGTVHTILSGMKSSIKVDVMVTCSASMTTDTLDKELDLDRGKFDFTMKPTEMFFREVSDKVGPLLDDTTRRKKEAANKAERFIASRELAEFAMRNLKI